MSTTTENLGLFKYDPVLDADVNFNIETALNYNWDILDQRVGSSRNIGEIVSSTLPLTDASLHLLDGSLIEGGGIYSAFVDYMADLYNANRTLATVVVRPIAISEGYELGSNPDDTCTATSNNSFNTGSSPYYIQYDTSTSGESSSSSSSPDENGIVIDDPIDVPSIPDPICLPTNTEITFNNLGIFDYTFTTSQGDITVTFQILFDQCTYMGIIPNYFCTEEQWQTAVTAYGVCGKFVYDSENNTVRLPKITGIVEGTTDVSALGDLIEAGLPVMTTESAGSHAHYINAECWRGADGNNKAARWCGGDRKTGSATGWTNTTGDHTHTINTGVGVSDTVQPQTIKVLYYIVIATITKTNIEVDIDEIATDLNTKVDFDGTNAAFPHIVETYVNGTSGYNLYSNGYCEQWGYSTVGSSGSISLLKAYSNTDYNISLIQSTGGGTPVYASPYKGSTTTTSFPVTVYGGGNADVWWKTGGYIR